MPFILRKSLLIFNTMSCVGKKVKVKLTNKPAIYLEEGGCDRSEIE